MVLGVGGNGNSLEQTLNKYLLNKLKKKVVYSRRPTGNQGDRTDPLGQTGGSSGGRVWVAALLTRSDPTLSPDRLGIPHPPICGLEPIEGMLLRAGAKGPRGGSPLMRIGRVPTRRLSRCPSHKGEGSMQGGSGRGASSLCGCLGPVCAAVSAPPLIRHVERFRLPGSLCGRVARLRAA